MFKENDNKIPEKELDDLCADKCLRDKVNSLEQRVKALENYIKTKGEKK